MSAEGRAAIVERYRSEIDELARKGDHGAVNRKRMELHKELVRWEREHGGHAEGDRERP